MGQTNKNRLYQHVSELGPFEGKIVELELQKNF
jgi:hypothetical protein